MGIRKGQAVPEWWACLALLPEALSRVGRFDPNLLHAVPAAADFLVRVQRAGLWANLVPGATVTTTAPLGTSTSVLDLRLS